MIHQRTLKSLEFPKIVAVLEGLCKSPGGRLLASQVEPFATREEAEQAIELYKEACAWATADPKNSLGTFPDISGLLSTIARKSGSSGLPDTFTLDIEDFWGLRETLRIGQQLVSSIVTTYSHQWPLLLARAERNPFPVQLLAALNRCLSDDGLLKDESSPELFRLRTELRRLHQNCLKKVRDYAQQYNMLSFLQGEFMTLASDRYVLPLKANFKGRMQGIIHDWSQTGETCYFEPYFLVEINNRLQELKHQEREEERQILRYLTGLLDNEYNAVEGINNLLSDMDLLQAKRLLAQSLDANPPVFCDNRDGIELLEVRHPLLTLSRRDQKNPKPVYPVNLVLRPGERALIITGGNAGGKTVCLKSMGLLAAMAMSALPVPASENSSMPWFDRIDAFIGDEQSLTDNVSTFSAQIEHLSKALPHLKETGMALLDEFGAGTDPAEGAALAQATHDELLEKKCFVISATHFPALKTYALSREGVRAATMLFDPVTSKPLYKLAYDQVGSSQALTVAAEYGLPESILKKARHYLLQDGEDTNLVLKQLNELAVTREREIEQLRREQTKSRSLTAAEHEKLARERKRLQTEVRENIRTLMHAWKSEKANSKQTLKAMSGLRAELGLPDFDQEQPILPVPENFAIGARVHHAGLNKNGVITDLDSKRNRARVDLAGVSVWSALHDLRITSSSESSPVRAIVHASAAGMPAPVLDVRGQRAETALAEVEKFLDKAVLSGSSEIEIIHGRGTGALRREIHNYLRNFPGVESMRLAPEDRGGDGMTIVMLK